MYSQETIDKADNWYKNGQVGLSSHTMWLWFLNKTCSECDVIHSTSYPYDWDDFRRCYLLLEEVPEFKPELYRLKQISPIWEKLVEKWPQLIKLYESQNYNQLNIELNQIHQAFQKNEFTKPRAYKSVTSSETIEKEETNKSLLARVKNYLF